MPSSGCKDRLRTQHYWDTAGIGVALADSGAIDVGRGTLSLSNYAPAASSKLTIGVSANSGQLSVSGSAALSGTLALSTKAGYVPPVGTKVTILTAGMVLGTFGSLTGTQLSGEHWVVSYKVTSVVLTAVAADEPRGAQRAQNSAESVATTPPMGSASLSG